MSLLKQFGWLRFPVLVLVAVGGIIGYNGINTMKVDPQLGYRQFSNYERAERYLRENYDMTGDNVGEFLKKNLNNYMFFQASFQFEKVAPFQMTFLYGGEFPVTSDRIYWHAIDDRYQLSTEVMEVYEKDGSLFLKLEGDLVFTPRPLMDSLKYEMLKNEGFSQSAKGLVKHMSYDIKLSAVK